MALLIGKATGGDVPESWSDDDYAFLINTDPTGYNAGKNHVEREQREGGSGLGFNRRLRRGTGPGLTCHALSLSRPVNSLQSPLAFISWCLSMCVDGVMHAQNTPGRSYIYRANDKVECDSWVEALGDLSSFL